MQIKTTPRHGRIHVMFRHPSTRRRRWKEHRFWTGASAFFGTGVVVGRRANELVTTPKEIMNATPTSGDIVVVSWHLNTPTTREYYGLRQAGEWFAAKVSSRHRHQAWTIRWPHDLAIPQAQAAIGRGRYANTEAPGQPGVLIRTGVVPSEADPCRRDLRL